MRIIGAKALKKSLEQQNGVPVSMRTAAQARRNILVAGSTEIKESSLPRSPQPLRSLRRRLARFCGIGRGDMFDMTVAKDIPRGSVPNVHIYKVHITRTNT